MTDTFCPLDWKDGPAGLEILDATSHFHDDLLQDAEII